MAYLTVICQLLVWGVALGCSPPVGQEIPNYTLEETFEMVPIVVSGKYLAHDEQDRANVTFQVSCVFKSGGLTIDRVIFLLGIGLHSCGSMNLDLGQSYIIGLEKIPPENLNVESSSDRYFEMSLPNAYQSSAFETTSENLELTSNLCAMDNVTLSLGEGGPDDHECPVRTVTMETCVSGAPAVVLSLVLYALVSFVLVL